MIELNNGYECYISSRRDLSKRSSTFSKNYSKRALWGKRQLTYSLFGVMSPWGRLSFESARKTLQKAFTDWSKRSCFTFRYLKN